MVQIFHGPVVPIKPEQILRRRGLGSQRGEDLRGFGVVFSALVPLLVQSEQDTVISFNGGHITLKEMDASLITGDDFEFGLFGP